MDIKKFEVLTQPTLIKESYKFGNSKTRLRIRFKQKDLVTGKITEASYGCRNFDVLMKKEIGDHFVIKTKELQNNLYEITVT